MNFIKLEKLLFLMALLFMFGYAKGQNENDSILIVVEDYLLRGDNGAAISLLEKNSSDIGEKRTHSLLRVANEEGTYADYKTLLLLLQSRRDLSYAQIHEFIQEKTRVPSDQDEVDMDFVELRWTQITDLRNENLLDEASLVNSNLKDYVERFDKEQLSTQKAEVYLLTHDVVMAFIARKAELSEALSLKIDSIAKQLNDTNLMILACYHLGDYYVATKQLENYIAVSERSFELDSAQKKKSQYYLSNIVHLIDGYVYKGGEEEKAFKLIEILYNDRSIREESYSLYMQFLGKVALDSPLAQKVFDQFGADNLPALADTLSARAENKLDPGDMFHLYNESGNALEAHNYLKKAIYYKDRTIVHNRKVYGKDLSKSLADHETNLVRKEKELEVAYEKEQTKLYSFIAILVGILFLLSVVAIIRQRKQAKLLAEKKTEVETALHEKQLLLKEVHHRVKNNFQIISSLLELQSKGIEDEKAKELASEGRNRVKSMALIHQKLYQNDDLLIYFNDYIDKLVNEISSMYGAKNETKVSLDVDKLAFDIDTAIPLGLIVNELVTNAFKYGQDAKEKEIKISIRKDNGDYYKLQVKDNGVGLPENLDISKAKSLGLRLVRRLSKQLHGSVNYYNDNGAIFEVLFKNTEARGLVD